MRTANPSALWLVRHGQSLGNVARDAAHDADLERLELAERDMDVPLSPLGREQARGFGEWLGAERHTRQPEVIITSPYRRAVETAETIAEAAGLANVPLRRDERLRERELGVLDLLTRRGVEAQYPQEAERRTRLGKFYHRPPGGESWVDVGLRLRSWRDSMAREHDRQRLLVVAHEVVIVMMRYLIEELTEDQALALSSDDPLANCSLTAFDADRDGRLELRTAGWTVPVAASGAAVTVAPDAAVAPVADVGTELERDQEPRRAPLEVTADLLRGWPIPLDDDEDKFGRGSVLVIGGSARTPGAVELAGIAALRAGAGRLQLATVASVAPALSIAVPEALVESLPESDDGAIEPGGDLGRLEERVRGADAVLIGPGLEDPARTTALLRWVLERIGPETVLVIDALGLVCLAELDRSALRAIGDRTVLTPNRGECAQLLPALDDEPSDGERAARCAETYGAVTTVHGHTAASDGRCWSDSAGTVGLATSGSGDVLAGLIVGVAARCRDAAQAACWGGHLHAAAGLRLAERMAPVGFLAREIADEAPLVLAALSR